MKTIRQTYRIHSSPQEVWKALTNPKYIDGWGGGPTKIDDKEGTEFEFWGGDIHGKNEPQLANLPQKSYNFLAG